MRVVITGAGVVSPLGSELGSFTENIFAGKSGVRTIDLYDLEDIDCQIAGQIENFSFEPELEKSESRIMDRFTQLGLVAALRAWNNSGIDSHCDRERVAVLIGTGIGGIGAYEQAYVRLDSSKRGDAFTVPRVMNNAAASWAAMKLGLKGRNQTINTACSSGGNAIGEAFRAIRSQECEVVLCGGTEAPMARKFMRTWNAMKVLSKHYDDPSHASRPFDLNRDGLVMAEGAAMLILESLDSARQRGAKIWAEVVGFASNCDCHSLTVPHPDGQTSVMSDAIKDAGIQPEEIDYINGHGTGTRINDRVETESIKRLFGEYAQRLPISSSKSMLGHSMGASSALEALICALSLEHGYIPPTINYTTPDPDCDLDYVPNQGRQQSLNYVMSNSFGFGGNNAVLVFKKW